MMPSDQRVARYRQMLDAELRRFAKGPELAVEDAEWIRDELTRRDAILGGDPRAPAMPVSTQSAAPVASASAGFAPSLV